MAWTAPMTAVSGAAFTAAQFNQHVRDNLLETAPAKVSTAGDYLVATGLNSIVARQLGTAGITTTETTTSTTYTDLTTTGPSLTRTTGARSIVGVYSFVSHNTAAGYAFASFDVTGSSSTASSDNFALQHQAAAAASSIRASSIKLLVGLTPGSNVFTMRYRVNTGTGTFSDRSIIVIPY